jgi:hypothetical protein
VALNSNHYNETHYVQNSWLDTNLAATTQPLIFVYAHEPAYPAGPHIGSSLDFDVSARDAFWNIMSKAGVGIYFCGHEHLYQRTQHGVVTQVIAGTCGAPLATGYAGTIAQYHYVVVNVNGYHVQCTAKNDTGAVIDTWDYTVAPACSDLSSTADSKTVLLNRKTITRANGTVVHIEEDNRTSGFMAQVQTGLAPGANVNIQGVLQTLSTGERQILGTAYTVSPNSPVPKPLGMRISHLLGGPNGYNPGADGAYGLNNYALRVRVFGKVKATNGNLFYVDDGSDLRDGTSWGSPNVGVRVSWSGAVSVNQFATITGVVSCFKDAGKVCRMIYASEVL